MVSKRTIILQWIKLYALGQITETQLRRRSPEITDELMRKLRTKYKSTEST